MSDLSEKLAAIEALEQAATPGPWALDAYRTNIFISTFLEDGTRRGLIARADVDDAEFIVAVRNEIRPLLALVRDQAAKLAKVEALAEEWHTSGESDMAASKTIPNEHASMALLTEGASMVENARHVRNAIRGEG